MDRVFVLHSCWGVDDEVDDRIICASTSLEKIQTQFEEPYACTQTYADGAESLWLSVWENGEVSEEYDLGPTPDLRNGGTTEHAKDIFYEVRRDFKS